MKIEVLIHDHPSIPNHFIVIINIGTAKPKIFTGAMSHCRQFIYTTIGMFTDAPIRTIGSI